MTFTANIYFQSYFQLRIFKFFLNNSTQVKEATVE